MKFSNVVKARFSRGERKDINKKIEERLGGGYDLIFYLEDSEDRSDYDNHLVVLPKGMAYVKKNLILAYDSKIEISDHPRCPGVPNIKLLERELERDGEVDIAYRNFDQDWNEAANLLIIRPHFPGFVNRSLTNFSSGVRRMEFLKEWNPRGDYVLVDGKKYSLDE